jgi:hypothetical protein
LTTCKEFITLSNLAGDKSNKDPWRDMEFIAKDYEESKVWNLLIRHTLIAYEILYHCIVLVKVIAKNYEAAGQYLERAAKVLARFNEVPGLFYEQAGYMLVYRTPAMIRKFVYRVLLAGEIYLEQGLLQNAIYCFGICCCIYERKWWYLTLTRLYAMLIRIFTETNDLPNKFRMHRKLLEIRIATNPNTPHTEVYNKFIEVAIKLDSYLPENSDLREYLYFPSLVVVQPEAFDIQSTTDQFYTNNDLKLSVDNSNGVYNTSQSWVFLGRMLEDHIIKSELDENSLVKAKEEVLRDLLFFDEVKTIDRIASYQKRQRIVHCSEPITVNISIKNQLNLTIEITKMQLVCHYLDSEVSKYKVIPVSFTLSPFGNELITLPVIPQMTGLFSVDGIEWEISNTIHGDYSFTQETKKSPKKAPVVLVKEEAGQLAVAPKNSFKSEYFSGEIVNWTLNLMNVGSYPIEDIVIHTDHSVLFGWKHLQFDWILKPSEERQLQITFRAVKAKHVKVLFRYRSLDKVRYTRLEHVFRVLPSMKIISKCCNSRTSINECLLNIMIKEVNADCLSFVLKEVYVMDVQAFLKSCTGHNVMIILSKLSKNNSRILLQKDKELHSEEDQILAIIPHIKECDDFKETDVIRSIILWQIRTEKQVIDGAHYIKTPYETVKPTLNKSLFPLHVIVSCPNTLKHDYNLRP